MSNTPLVMILSLVLVASGMSGCVTTGGAPPTPTQQAQSSCPFFSQKMLMASAGGAIAGAAGGALATRGKVSARDVLFGALAGALIAGSIGKILDKRDCESAKAAMQKMGTAPVGTQVAWVNPESGNRGTQTPTSDPTIGSNGQLCRAYHETLYLKNGTQRQQDGTTCRDAAGDWHAVN